MVDRPGARWDLSERPRVRRCAARVSATTVARALLARFEPVEHVAEWRLDTGKSALEGEIIDHLGYEPWRAGMGGPGTAGLRDQDENQPDERMECRGGKARAELGQESGQRTRCGGAGSHRRITLTRTVNGRSMLSSSYPKISQQHVTGVSRPTDQRQRQETAKARGPGHDWGDSVVWNIASHHPERCECAAVLCVPIAG